GRASLGISQAVLTILDSDTGAMVAFGAPTFTVAENVAGGTASIKVVRTGTVLAGQSVLFSTTGGSATPDIDYTPVSQTVTFGAGQTTATVAVPIINNGDIVGNRVVGL